MTRQPLLSKDAFVNLDGLAHLCTGGESPWLKSHSNVFERFSALKSAGNRGRDEVLATMETTRRRIGSLWGVSGQSVSFMPASCEGMNYLARGINWQPGDNIVTTALEFPSVAWAWRDLSERGVEIRAVQPRDWLVDECALLNATDRNTRLMAVSQVSYYTGQHLDIEKISQGLDRERTLLAVDSTHASGVLPVSAALTDLTISSGYKWMLATTGTAPCYVSPKTLEEVRVTSVGWHNMRYGPPPNPAQTQLLEMPELLEPGNPALLNIMLLDNALATIQDIGIDAISEHARGLAAEMRTALQETGATVISPADPLRQSGNTCISHADGDRMTKALDSRNVLVWGDRGRLRFSTHLYNDSADVQTAASALKELL